MKSILAMIYFLMRSEMCMTLTPCLVPTIFLERCRYFVVLVGAAADVV
jgi:hypothetical protein